MFGFLILMGSVGGLFMGAMAHPWLFRLVFGGGERSADPPMNEEV